MTPQEAAALIDGRQYRDEVTAGIRDALKLHGLVAVFGASDDLMEFNGAINNEIGCYNGGTAYLDRSGLIENDCENDRCPHFEEAKKGASTIEALWDVDGFSWRYKTNIPHATFIIREDDENYCEGIVFALADVPTPAPGA